MRTHPDRFADKSTYSMDWYYPVLGGAVRGDAARELLARRWDDFVVPGLGIHCVDTNPWVTGAETCELAMALDVLGDSDSSKRALALLADVADPTHPVGKVGVSSNSYLEGPGVELHFDNFIIWELP